MALRPVFGATLVSSKVLPSIAGAQVWLPLDTSDFEVSARRGAALAILEVLIAVSTAQAFTDICDTVGPLACAASAIAQKFPRA